MKAGPFLLGPAACLLAICLTPPSWAQSPQQPSSTAANAARSGARLAGMNVGIAKRYCQMPPAIAFPPGLLERYCADARRHFAADPTFGEDFAYGQSIKTVDAFYAMAAQSSPATAEQARRDSCTRLIAAMERETHSP
ncbi:hypothetical protein [Acidocella sp.]|uniref:hypothetical protein n=1 Tax=Acidocella sp. TaxID=50710 RepID=UPI003D012528